MMSYYTGNIELTRMFKDKVNWGWISCKQKLSESFIKEFQDKLK